MDPDAHPAPGETPRRDNGLSAPAYVPLADVDPAVGEQLLTALGRARIAAYLEPAAEPDRQRLFVASGDRADARTIVEVAARADGAATRPPDLLEGVDTDAVFDALVADWHVDTINAVKSAERDLTREDADWRARLEPGFSTTPTEEETEHYVPPPPPPLPRLAGVTIWALIVLSLSIIILSFGSAFGLDSDFTFLVGVAGVLLGAGMLLMRLRTRPPDDEDDDGAVV
jgi:hypothetical protein